MIIVIEAVHIRDDSRTFHSSDRIEVDIGKRHANPREIMAAVDKAVAQCAQRKNEFEASIA